MNNTEQMRISAGMLVGLLLTGFLHLAWGSVALSPNEIWSGIVTGKGVPGSIVRDIRLPRVAIAISAGGGLALSGLLMQTFFRNPLAGPSVLGVSSGASLGVAVAVLGGHWVGGALGLSGMAVAACAGSFAVLAFVLFVAARHGGTIKLLVFGLMLSYAVGAMVSVLQSAARQSALQEFVFWGMGTFGSASLRVAGVLALITGIVAVMAFRQTRSLDAWTLGSRTAESMGVASRPFRGFVLASTGILTGLITASCGPIAFLGLAAPHVVRLLFAGRGHHQLIPMTLLAGSWMALLADLVVRAPWSDGAGWPLNAVLSLLGAPMVLHVLLKRTWND